MEQDRQLEDYFNSEKPNEYNTRRDAFRGTRWYRMLNGDNFIPRHFNTLNTFVTCPFHNSMSMTGAGTVSRRARIQHLPSSLTLRDRLGWFLQAKTFFQTSTQHTRKWEFKARHRDLSLMFTINESFCKQDGGEVQALEEAMHQPFLKKKLKTRGLSRSNSSYTRYGNSLLFMNITSVYHGIPAKSLK